MFGLIYLASEVASRGRSRYGQRCTRFPITPAWSLDRISSEPGAVWRCRTVVRITGIGSTHASVAVRPKYRDRQACEPFARRAKGIAWKIIDGRLGCSGARCDRRLALLDRENGLANCKLGLTGISAVRLQRPMMAPHH
jgi:hypothetical protein